MSVIESPSGYEAMIIRAEKADDHLAVQCINELAFGRPNEGALVDSLRAVTPHISLVAFVDGRAAGHVLFSPVQVESEEFSFLGACRNNPNDFD